MVGSGRASAALTTLVLAACGPPPYAPARTELLAAADRRLAEGAPAQALVDLEVALEIPPPSAELRARRDQAALALATHALASAEPLRALAVLDALAAREIEPTPAVRAQVRARVVAELTAPEQATFGGEPGKTLRMLRVVTLLAPHARDAELDARVAGAVEQVRATHVRRAGEADDAPLLADLHARVAAALGMPVSDDLRALFGLVVGTRGMPLYVSGGGPGCDELMQGLRDRNPALQPVQLALAFHVRLDLTCTADGGRRSIIEDGRELSGYGYEFTIRGKAVVEVLGERVEEQIDDVGRHGLVRTDEGVNGLRAARREAGSRLHDALRQGRTRALPGIKDTIAARLDAPSWRERDLAAAVLWLLDADPRGLERLYGLDHAAATALYVADAPTLPPLVVPKLALPERDAGPAIEALEAHRRRYGDRTRVYAEGRPFDLVRSQLGASFQVAASPLASVDRAHGVGLQLGLGPFVQLSGELQRTWLGGDARGWALGWRVPFPLSEETFIGHTGLRGGRQVGAGDERHSHLSTPVVVSMGTTFFLLSTGVEINWLRVKNGRGGDGAPYHFIPWVTALELPSPIGPTFYLRGEVIGHLGAPDPWTFGLALGLRAADRTKLRR